MKPSREGLIIKPFAENPAALSSVLMGLRGLNAAKASCYHVMDQQRILAVIEAGYGSLSAFNRSLQTIIRKELDLEGDDARHIEDEDVEC